MFRFWFKAYSIFFIIMFGVLPLYAAKMRDQKVDAVPHLYCESPVYNFGTLEQGTTVSHSFDIVNKGFGTLIISKVRSTCECAAASFAYGEIFKGKKGTVDIVFNTFGLKGFQRKIVYVHSNDPDQPILPLTLEGDLTSDIELRPDHIDFGQVARGTSATKNAAVKLRNNKKVLNIESDSSYITAGILPSADNKESSVSVILSSRAPAGFMDEKLRIITSSSAQRVHYLDVRAEIVNDIQAKPEKIIFSMSKGEGALKSSLRTVILSALSGTRFSLHNAVASPPIITVKIVPEGPSARYVLMVSIDPSVKLDALKGELRLSTDYKEQPLIVIPFEFVQ